MSSITEVVQTVKDPRARSQGEEEEPMEPPPPVTPARAGAAATASLTVGPGTASGGAGHKSPLWDLKKEDSLSRKLSGRGSFMGSVTRGLTLAAGCSSHDMTWHGMDGFLAGSRWGRGARWEARSRRCRRRR